MQQIAALGILAATLARFSAGMVYLVAKLAKYRCSGRSGCNLGNFYRTGVVCVISFSFICKYNHEQHFSSTDMKTVKHICFTSHGEVMFRNSQDVGVLINLLALNSWKYDIAILADCEMSTHVHLVVMADSANVSGFVKNLRCQYTGYFSSRYGRARHNRLGEKNFFCLDVFGISHIQSALSYVLRNPVHHGVTSTPFAYPFSSVNDLFPMEMGRFERPHIAGIRDYSLGRSAKFGTKIVEKHKTVLMGSSQIWGLNCITGASANEMGNNLITSKQVMKTFLPRSSEWPDEWVMSENGVFLRPCFEEISQTEGYFVSPGTFQYNMFRKSDEKWLEEQNSDKNDKPPIQLSDVEPFANDDKVQEFKRNEKTYSRRCGVTYFDLCAVIDNCLVPQFQCRSVYQLDNSQKNEIMTMLVRDLHVSAAKVGRCLAM